MIITHMTHHHHGGESRLVSHFQDVSVLTLAPTVFYKQNVKERRQVTTPQGEPALMRAPLTFTLSPEYVMICWRGAQGSNQESKQKYLESVYC